MSGRKFNVSAARRVAPASVAPQHVMPEPEIRSDGKRDWTRYNAAVVGAVWVPNCPNNPGSLPGIPKEPAQPYKVVSAAAPRAYGPNEGWIHVQTRAEKLRAAERRRRLRRKYQEAEAEDD